MEAAARVTGQDLRRVLEPREQQVLVMMMRNGDGEHARRHTAQVLRLGVDEVDELLASARRKVEQVRLRKQARLDEEPPVVRPVEGALMDAAQAGGNGRAAHSAPTPVGHRSKRLARPERLARDDDEEAKVTTTAKREWEPMRAAVRRMIERAGPVEQRVLCRLLDISATDFSLNVAPHLKRDARFVRKQEKAGMPVVWDLADRPGAPVASDAGSGQDGDGSPAAGDGSPDSSSAGPDSDQPLGEVREWEVFRPMTPEAERGPLPTAREEETSADPVGTGDAESVGVVSAAASAHEPSPPPERAGGDSAGGESDGGSLPSRNGGDAPEAVATDPEGSSADGSPSSETPPAHDAEFVPQLCAECGEPISAQEATVANVGDPRAWHSGCAPALPLADGPPPFAGMGPQPSSEVMRAFGALLRRSAQPERSPRERYVDVLLSKLDGVRSREDAVGSQVDEVELMDRIERQLDALG